MAFKGMGEFWAPAKPRRKGPDDLLAYLRNLIQHGKWKAARIRQDNLAGLFGVTTRTIRRWLAKLAPFIERIRRGWHRANGYKIKPDIVLPRMSGQNVRSDRPGPYVSNSGFRILKIIQRVKEYVPINLPPAPGRKPAVPKTPITDGLNRFWQRWVNP